MHTGLVFSDMANEEADIRVGVNKLHPELLVYIFQVLQSLLGWPWVQDGCVKLPFPVRMSWIRVTWVCRYWRLIALESPSLWASIVHEGLWSSETRTFLAAFLERSREAPLTVDIRYLGEEPRAALTQLLPRAHNVRHLELWMKTHPVPALIIPFIRNSSTLRQLRLFNMGMCIPLSPDEPAESANRLVLHLSTDHFPYLRSLDLYGVDVEWDTFSLKSLHKLSLDMLSKGPSATILLRIMKDSPDLRTLKLGSGKLLPGPRAAGIEDVISLPQLDELQISGNHPGDVTYVLDRITVPSACSIFATSFDVQDASDLISAILPRQLAFHNVLPSSVSIGLYVSEHNARLFVAHQDRRHLIDLSAFCDSPAVPSTTLTEDAWKSILNTFSGASLTRCSIHCHSHSDISTRMWTALCERFPLEAIEMGFRGTIGERGRPSLLENMFLAMRAPSGHRVRTAEFRNLTLNEETTGEIFDLMEHRALVDAPFRKLVFTTCYCARALDTEKLKTRLESYVTLVIQYRAGMCPEETDAFRKYYEVIDE